MKRYNATVILDHVTKKFGDFTAVDNLSLEVRPGRIYGLLGPNGAGKTTTIRMIVNITVPDSGRIELFGRRITGSNWLFAGGTWSLQEDEDRRTTKVFC